MTLKLDACIAQHQGDRSEQQDRLALVAHTRTSGAALAIVADGMGGHTGGALAAEQVVHTVCGNFQRWGPNEDPHAMLKESFMEAHEMIKTTRFINEKDPHSTGVALMLQPGGRHCIWAHCGDSRLYAFRGLHLRVRTIDHSYVEHLVQTGKITADEAETHPNRNILLTSLGGAETPKLDFGGVDDIHPGDSFLLCSDGLWGYFDDEELGALVTTGTAREVLNTLIRLVRARGENKGDNISIALLKFG
ncbi:MAG: protein phosphatase 2C domain-containing protein [Zoogloeaceae bacterium]|jgi:serine/threonine protein phosphatase PrpC|nr:protein phosphatase 2C domain-containing protein [Zoogloeaceae bacterium]